VTATFPDVGCLWDPIHLGHTECIVDTIRGPAAVTPSAGPAASGDDAAASRPGRATARLARVVENALTTVDLSLPQYRMLIFLAEGGSAAASALAGKLGVSRPSVTALVDGLVARGLAERSTDPVDRRRVAHVVTPAGLDALERADQVVEARLAELAASIPEPADRAAAYAGLAIWHGALNAERDAKLTQQ
jgi:DNA-binding MarR family transcriptional regulator